MSEGFIKLSRSLMEWEWYKDCNTCRLFIHCLLKANFVDGNFKGKVIKRGQFATSYSKLEIETELTCNEIRTAISHLKLTGEVTVKNCSKYSVITVVNYDKYQDVNKVNNKQECNQNTVESQSINVLLTTIEEEKEIKNIKKDTKVSKESRFTPPTLEDVKAYCKERRNEVDASKFVDFYECKGWMVGKNKMIDWKAAIRTWEQSDAKKDKPRFNTFQQNEYDFEDLEKEILAN